MTSQSTMAPVYAGDAMQLINISHAYNTGPLVLRNISLAIPNIVGDGQVIGWFGRSGRGKTTLAMIIAGLMEASEGEVLAGSPLRRVTAGEVGMVWQESLLMDHDTVLSNLTFAGMRRGKVSKKDASDRALEMLERFNLIEHKDKYPDEISGGQRRRVAILQQVLCTAQQGSFVLVLDEPFTGLDEVSKRHVCELIVECSRLDEFATIWLISHDVPETLAVSDHAVLLGWEYDANNEPIQGATILQTYDVSAEGLIWRDRNILERPEFTRLCRKVIADIEKDDPVRRKLGLVN